MSAHMAPTSPQESYDTNLPLIGSARVLLVGVAVDQADMRTQDRLRGNDSVWFVGGVR